LGIEREHREPVDLKSVSSEAGACLAEGESRFINRELSWLAFNGRVLEEATNKRQPLLERVRFLSISASNMDEFYMVRVAGLKAQIRADLPQVAPDGKTPLEQITVIKSASTELRARQTQVWRGLRAELRQVGLIVVAANELTQSDNAWLGDYFNSNVFPVLTPLAIDPAHPFPFLPNLGFALAVQLIREETGEGMRAHVLLPRQISRLVRLPGLLDRYITLEDVVLKFIKRLFPGYSASGAGLFRIIRDSDIEVSDEADDLIVSFERAIRDRRRGNLVRLEISDTMPTELREMLIDELEAGDDDVSEVSDMLGLHQMDELLYCGRQDLLFPRYTARFPERIREFGDDCFAAIREKDILVHHPYESFDVVVQLLEQAAADPDVIAIKQTLYRTTPDSPIVSALVRAAESGKSVTALVELKARFNEEENLRLAQRMERVGIQVVYGFIDLKTHVKISYVVRREEKKLRTYTHYGTGNYHPVSAKIFSDLSFFTCSPELAKDAATIFNFLTGYGETPRLNQVAFAPITLRETINELIDKEIKNAEEGVPAEIWAKMNSLVDPDVIDRLYQASQAGVRIQLIIRGICCLRAQVRGLSEHIHVKSIVGRFLEHSRIWVFGNGKALPHADGKLFISSADWMPRNLDRRCEVMVPITNATVHEQILEQILVANLKDDLQSWEMAPSGRFERQKPSGLGFSCHEYFMTNPSLSGRGKALERYGGPAQLRVK